MGFEPESGRRLYQYGDRPDPSVGGSMIDGKMICGAGGGGFLQVMMKKGVTHDQLHRRLKEVFQDNDVDVWPCQLVFNRNK